jgi:hypothetical protein
MQNSNRQTNSEDGCKGETRSVREAGWGDVNTLGDLDIINFDKRTSSVKYHFKSSW